ncbi:MAG: hypothetical protein ACI9O0_000997 [Paracoccaceae bacterium]|jgi:hypothetical protein
MRLFKFDFGEIASIEGSPGMIWDKGWTPPGGSEDLADTVVTDEGSIEIPEAEIENWLLAIGAPKPTF